MKFIESTAASFFWSKAQSTEIHCTSAELKLVGCKWDIRISAFLASLKVYFIECARVFIGYKTTFNAHKERGDRGVMPFGVNQERSRLLAIIPVHEVRWRRCSGVELLWLVEVVNNFVSLKWSILPTFFAGFLCIMKSVLDCEQSVAIGWKAKRWGRDRTCSGCISLMASSAFVTLHEN